MLKSTHKIWICLLGLVSLVACKQQEQTPKFQTTDWVIELTDSTSYFEVTNDTLDIYAKEGLTLWYNQKLTGDYQISYLGTAVTEGGAFDRLSDFNCFWAATDPNSPDDLFVQSAWRQGKLHNYYQLNLYYVGYGGNENKTTRFRKYLGDGTAPLIQEYTDAAHLLAPNTWYRVDILMQGNKVTYKVNDETLFTLEEESDAFRDGYFGFRTFNSHLRIADFSVTLLP